jgi:creatinine amidohydrolase
MKLMITAGLMLTLSTVPSLVLAQQAAAATNPLWHEQKIKNYLPDMTWPEVQALLTRTDMVIIPVGALEEHGPQGPIGTDFYNGTEQAKLIAQRTDVLVAPIMMPGNSPYHMGFPGTITISAETLERVYFEAVQSLIRHGFRRFLLLNAHGGNVATTHFIVDRINQETAGVAVELNEAAQPFLNDAHMSPAVKAENNKLADIKEFDRHSGVGETSQSLYLIPSLVNMNAVRRNTLTLPPHLQAMLPQVVAGDRTANLVFLAEALKAKDTGKHTSTREMTETGNWTVADVAQASAERGKAGTDAFVGAAVQFIEKWKALRPNRVQ